MLRCDTCHRPLKRSEVAASVQRWTPNGDVVKSEWVWCFPCWDNPDEVALEQYRRRLLP